MLFYSQNAMSERHKDENGYLYVDKSPILRTGILEYYGSELSESGYVDGVKVDPDKIYKVFISPEELEKAKDTFKLLPITDDHTWLGDDGEDAKDYQVGMTGEDVFIENGMLYLPLKFTGKDVVDEVESHEKEELSSSYYNRFERAEAGAEYDFVARDIKGNHLALVDKGRCGSSVRVLNSRKGVEKVKSKKTCNEAILKLDGKEINLDQFFEEEAQEHSDGEEIHEDSISMNEDKREIIREIMAVAGKADSDFEGGEDEKVRTIAELAEKLAYNPSEESSSDNEAPEEDEEKAENEDSTEEESEEEKSENEEAEKEDEEKSENEDKDSDEEEKSENECGDSKSMNYDALYSKISNAIKVENEKKEAELKKAYNSACSVIGEFNPFGLTAKDMYAKALNHMGVELEGKESIAELSAMLKACSAVHSKVDNSFAYNNSSVDEVELNF